MSKKDDIVGMPPASRRGFFGTIAAALVPLPVAKAPQKYFAGTNTLIPEYCKDYFEYTYNVVPTNFGVIRAYRKVTK